MTEPIKQIVQVVKRFGLCGGMEEYVFQLSKELKSAGLNIVVLCEQKVSCHKDNMLEVIELGSSLRKPRWLSHLIFSKKVKDWINKNPLQGRIIHSHERISCHHITTIHSTLFNYPPRGFPSFRKFMNEWLERREITSDSVKVAVPVSHVIKDQIRSKYPTLGEKNHKPIVPGVDSKLAIDFSKVGRRVKTMGFLGQEWKRKGLAKVLSIWRELRNSGSEINLVLAGFDENEAVGIFENEKSEIQLLGWISDKLKFYSKIDILVHPAKKEAFGMVITEALFLKIPVVCSTQCGASMFNKEGAITALNESAPISEWVKEVQYLLDNKEANFPQIADWRTIAAQYIKLYENFISLN
jgi:UDP-glucose:(heptosyl)LPS alpha-1,3-glucosyltransferase